MTYAVVAVQNEREKVLGTIWAEGKSQAQAVATSLYPPELTESIHLRETESRELPLVLPRESVSVL